MGLHDCLFDESPTACNRRPSRCVMNLRGPTRDLVFDLGNCSCEFFHSPYACGKSGRIHSWQSALGSAPLLGIALAQYLKLHTAKVIRAARTHSLPRGCVPAWACAACRFRKLQGTVRGGTVAHFLIPPGGNRILTAFPENVVAGGVELCSVCPRKIKLRAAFRDDFSVRGAARHPKAIPRCGREARPQHRASGTEHVVAFPRPPSVNAPRCIRSAPPARRSPTRVRPPTARHLRRAARHTLFLQEMIGQSRVPWAAVVLLFVMFDAERWLV